MKSKFIFLFTFFIFVFQSNIPVYSQNHTPEPYTEDEFPAFMYDLRRAEIITLGSMPFITLGTSLGYSFGKYAYHGFDANYFSNPFAKTEEAMYSPDEQVGIILTSLGISLGIGITDFIVQSIKRNEKQKKLKNNNNSPIKITPISEDPDAVKVTLPNQAELNEIENKIEDDNLIIENQQEDVIEQKSVKNQKRLIDVVSEEEK